ncbi:MAG: OmpA family protein [Thiomargarita sp.]|nr:OmpA family protein [Thiomargarita sp.]
MNKWLYIILAFMLSACVSTGDNTGILEEENISSNLEETEVEDTELEEMIPIDDDATTITSENDGTAISEEMLEAEEIEETEALSEIPKSRIIYFGYDNSEISDESKKILEKHSTYLLQHSDAWLRLEGHTDERGSREYNLALSERRIYASKEALKALGVKEDQLMVLPYGEERPADFQQSEDAWLLNRRVELFYP